MLVFIENIPAKGLLPGIIRVAPVIKVKIDSPSVSLEKMIHRLLVISRNSCLSGILAPKEKHVWVMGKND